MHHIIAVFSGKQKVAALAPFVQQAREKYDQNLAAYIRLILRRPLSRTVVSSRFLGEKSRSLCVTHVLSNSRRITSLVSSNSFGLRRQRKFRYTQLIRNLPFDVFSPMFDLKISGKRSMLYTSESTSISVPTSPLLRLNTRMY